MSSKNHCCVPGCPNMEEKKEGSDIVLHCFPNPDKERDRFNKWIHAICGDILDQTNERIYKYRRVCRSHFDEKYCCRNNRISTIAVPTLNMPDIQTKFKFTHAERRPMKETGNLSKPSTSKDYENNANVPEAVDAVENDTIDVLDYEETYQEPVNVPEIENNTINVLDYEETYQEPVNVPEMDPEILTALGETTEEAPKFGAKIHGTLSQLWLPILRKGLNKETKEKLTKEYLIPENCQLLQPPKLNPEISAAVHEGARARDKTVEAVQQQLGKGITALNKGLELLLEDGKDRLQAIRYLSDSCRLLCDLHFIETEERKKLITPGLDRSFLNIMHDVDHDEMLFGNKLSEKIKATKVIKKKLSEKIKATKVIKKRGLQMKKPAHNPKPPSTSRSRPQVNVGVPFRFSLNRGAEEGRRRLRQPAGDLQQAKMLNRSHRRKANSMQNHNKIGTYLKRK